MMRRLGFLVIVLLHLRLAADADLQEGVAKEPSDEAPVIYVSNGIAAEVEGKVITVRELRERMEPALSGLRKQASDSEDLERLVAQTQKEALDDLISQRLLVSRFNKMGAHVPRAGMDAYKQECLHTQFGPRGPQQRQNYHRYLLSNGKTSNAFQKKLEEELEASIVGQSAYDGVSKTRLSPSELYRFYNQNLLHFYQDLSVKLRLIVLSGESTEQREQLAHAILDQLEQGVSFQDLAKKYSQDRLASRGGDYGWVTRTALRSDLFDLAVSLKPGQWSSAVHKGDATYIVMTEDKHPERIQPFDNELVQKTLHEKLYEQKRKQAQAGYIAKLQDDEMIYVKHHL